MILRPARILVALLALGAISTVAEAQAPGGAAAGKGGAAQGKAGPPANRGNANRPNKPRKPKRATNVGAIVAYPFPPSLIIRQTPEAHDEIQALLFMLRYD
jgi:hypothetical protein